MLLDLESYSYTLVCKNLCLVLSRPQAQHTNNAFEITDQMFRRLSNKSSGKNPEQGTGEQGTGELQTVKDAYDMINSTIATGESTLIGQSVLTHDRIKLLVLKERLVFWDMDGQIVKADDIETHTPAVRLASADLLAFRLERENAGTLGRKLLDTFREAGVEHVRVSIFEETSRNMEGEAAASVPEAVKLKLSAKQDVGCTLVFTAEAKSPGNHIPSRAKLDERFLQRYALETQVGQALDSYEAFMNNNASFESREETITVSTKLTSTKGGGIGLTAPGSIGVNLSANTANKVESHIHIQVKFFSDQHPGFLHFRNQREEVKIREEEMNKKAVKDAEELKEKAAKAAEDEAEKAAKDAGEKAKKAAKDAEEEAEKIRNQLQKSREEELRLRKEDAARQNIKFTVAAYQIEMNEALHRLYATPRFLSRLSSRPEKEIFVVGPREAGKSTIVWLMNTLGMNRWENMEKDERAIVEAARQPRGEGEASLRIARIRLAVSQPDQQVQTFAVDVQGDRKDFTKYSEDAGHQTVLLVAPACELFTSQGDFVFDVESQFALLPLASAAKAVVVTKWDELKFGVPKNDHDLIQNVHNFWSDDTSAEFVKKCVRKLKARLKIETFGFRTPIRGEGDDNRSYQARLDMCCATKELMLFLVTQFKDSRAVQ